MMNTTHCQGRSVRFMIATLVCLHTALAAYCQTQITHPAAYRNLNPWLEGANPAGISLNPVVAFSIVEAGYKHANGNFRKSADASTIHHFHVGSESFRQLGKLQLYGRLTYDNRTQNDRQWSTMLEPEAHLVNFGDTVAGKQTSESYNICGIIGIPLSARWTLGGALDYRASANKKNIDPRNKNDQSDLLFSPGLLFSAGRHHIGGNFIYRRIIEEIAYFDLSSNIERARTFYPLWFYINEDLQNKNNTKRNYRDNRLGGAVQFGTAGKQWDLLNEFKFTTGTEIVEISPMQDTKGGEIERLDLAYRGCFRFRSSLRHTLKVAYDRMSQTHFDNIQAKINQSTEMNIEDYGRQKRSAVLCNQTSLSYSLSRPNGELQDHWRFYAECGYKREETVFLVYPTRFSQPITQLDFKAGYDHRINFRQQSLEIMTQLGYSTGHGTLLKIYSENGAPMPETKIKQQYDLLQHDFWVETAESLSARLHVRYTHPVGEKYALSATAGTDYKQGLTAEVRNMHRINAMLAVGFIF